MKAMAMWARIRSGFQCQMGRTAQVVPGDPEALLDLPEPVAWSWAITSVTLASGRLVMTPASPSHRSASAIFSRFTVSRASPSTTLKRLAPWLESSSFGLSLRACLLSRRSTWVRRS